MQSMERRDRAGRENLGANPKEVGSISKDRESGFPGRSGYVLRAPLCEAPLCEAPRYEAPLALSRASMARARWMIFLMSVRPWVMAMARTT